MEQDFGSEYNSGGESGWTIYLGQTMYPYDHLYETKNVDEDDMSMVSDASSAPPHIQQQQEHEQDCKNNGVKGCRRQQAVEESRKIQDFECFIDDTASSTFSKFSHVGSNQDSEGNNSIADYSNDHIQGKSRFQDQFGVFKSSISDGMKGGGDDSSP